MLFYGTECHKAVWDELGRSDRAGKIEPPVAAVEQKGGSLYGQGRQKGIQK